MLKVKFSFLALMLFLLPVVASASIVRKSSDKEKIPFAAFLDSRAIPYYDADSVAFYQTGAAKYESLLRDMRAARHHIHCEYFIFANDSIAHALLDVMREKAKEGVECRLIVDGYYDRQRGYDYKSRLTKLRREGIDVHIYKPYEFPFIHRVLRDHRKIVVIDGRIAYTGGFNVADYNMKGKASYGKYIDTQVRLEGSCVEGLQFLFSEHYEKAGGQGFDGEAYYPYSAEEYRSFTGCGVAVLERGRQFGAKKNEMRRAVVKFIDSAKDSLHIVSPYLLPIPSVRWAIRRALKRGVHVEVLFSETGDTPLFDAGNMHYARHIMRHGAEIWLDTDAFQHSKIMMADGHACLVGSVNLDSRAMRWNEEVAVVILDDKATGWLDQSFAESQQESRRLTKEYYKILPYSKRIKGFFANYFLSWCL